MGHVNKSYVIFITPRSGSTWLAQRIASFGLLSHPGEYLNLETMNDSLSSNPSRNIYEYVDKVTASVTSPAGVFGLEISFFDLQELDKVASMSSLLPGEKFFYRLERENFVAQAISLYIAEQSNVFHRLENDVNLGDQCRENHIEFDVGRILYWAKHILQQEYGFSRWLERRDLCATTFTYERLCSGIDDVIVDIAAEMDVVLDANFDRKIAQTIKLGGSVNAAFEALFRSQFPDWCAHWQHARKKEWCD